jgi:hypothetical protein
MTLRHDDNAKPILTSLQVLESFVRKADPREYLRTPWLFNGHAYASDSWVIVRTPSHDVAAFRVFANNSVGPAAAMKIFDAKPPKTPYKKLDITTFEAIDCSACSGKGVVFRSVCGTCKGSGNFAHHGHTYECQTCDKNGTVAGGSTPCPCAECDSSGLQPFRVRIGNKRFAGHLLLKIAKLPNMEIATHENAEAPSPFKFDGGEGYIMHLKDQRP